MYRVCLVSNANLPFELKGKYGYFRLFIRVCVATMFFRGRRGVIDCQRFMQAVEGKNYIEVCLSHGRAAIPMLIQRRR